MRKDLLALGAFGPSSGLRGRIEILLARGRVFSPNVSTRRAGAGAAALLAVALAASLAPRWVALAQTLQFEVASIRPSPPGATRDSGGAGAVRYLPGGRLTAINAGLKDLIVSADRMQYWQITGGPKWADPNMMFTTDRFNIDAKAESQASRDELGLMLQSLLSDRFKLVIHRATRTGTVYNLVVGKGGHKLREVGMEDYKGNMRAGGGRVITDQLTMADLATHLTGQVQAPVLDKTGLKGAYKFSLVWTPEPVRLQGKGRDSENGEPGIDANGPSLSEALQEQLGLKLEASRGAVEYLVIDSAERPDAN